MNSSFEILSHSYSNNLTEEATSSLYTIYCSKKTFSIIRMLKIDKKNVDKIKFTVLLFALLWEETNLIKDLYKIYWKDFENEIGFNKNVIISQFYSKNNTKIYEKAFLECINIQEYQLIKEIYSLSANFKAFTEKFLVESLPKIQYSNLQDLPNLRIKFFPYVNYPKNNFNIPLELNIIVLLRLMCKARFSEVSLYLFATNYCTIEQSITIFIKEKKNRLAQILYNTYPQYRIKEYSKFFKIASKFHNYKFIVNNLKGLFYFEPHDLNINKMLSHLIISVNNSFDFIDLKIYILRVMFANLDFFLCNKLLLIFMQKICLGGESNILLFVANPLKTLLLILDLIVLIKEKFICLIGLAEKLLKVIKEKCLIILESIQYFSEITNVFDDRLFGEENTIDLICKFRLFELLKNPKVQLYIHQQWDCSDQNAISFFDISIAKKVISNFFFSNPLENFKKYIHIPNKYLKGSFVDYVRNPISKYRYSLFFDFIILILLFVLILQYNSMCTYINSEINQQNLSKKTNKGFLNRKNSTLS